MDQNKPIETGTLMTWSIAACRYLLLRREEFVLREWVCHVYTTLLGLTASLDGRLPSAAP